MDKETEEDTQQGLAKKMGRPRKRANVAPGVNLDADKTIAVEKPLTGSREKATHFPQTSNVQPTTTSTRERQIIKNTQIGNGSSLIIVKKPHE